MKIFKWIGLSVGSLLLLIILAGLFLRLISPKPYPPGKLVDIGGFKLHINSTGEKSNKPTLVVEAGAGLPSEHYYWLGEGLKDSMRVVRYDRAGIGYSDLSKTPRDPKTIARELHTLLEKAGESPPYILAGHSFGGLYIRVFTQLYPEEVVAMVFLDSSHPDQRKRWNLPSPGDNTWKLNIVAVLGDLGILNLADRTIGPILPGFVFCWLLLSFLIYKFSFYKILGMVGLLVAATVADRYMNIRDNPITIPLIILFWLGVTYLILPQFFKKYQIAILSVYGLVISYHFFVFNTTPNYTGNHRLNFASFMLFPIPVFAALWVYEQWRWLKTLQADKGKTELALLKSQINPHFFFNTLNNLYSLTIKNSDKAPEVILKLSDMMRYTIYEGKKDVVFLKN